MRSAELIAVLVRDLDTLAGEDVGALSSMELRDELLAPLGAVDRLGGQVTRRVDVFDARCLSAADGCRSTRSWLRGFGRLSEFSAGEQVRGAQVLRELPALAGASAGGGLSGEHLRHVSRLARRVGVGVVARAEPVLVEGAARLDPTDFGRVCDRVRAHVDPDDGAPDAGEVFARRELVLSPSDGMVLVHGRLDPEGGAALISALDALTPPPAEGDTRPARQRQADALVELARGALTDGRLPVVGGVRPQVGVLVTPGHLVGRSSGGGSSGGGSSGGDAWGGDARAGKASAGEGALAAAPPWLEWIGEVAAPVAQRIACDADVWRVVLDPATGRPTEVGRSHRLVPVWIRRALHVRDRGCRFPGCRAPVAWTDAHHIRPWARGGPTDVDNLILLCRFHHGLVHEGRWTIRLDTDTGEVSAGRPDGRPYEIRDHRMTLANSDVA
jgi:hypothetical protein